MDAIVGIIAVVTLFVIRAEAVDGPATQKARRP